ncbi:hypothetical protein DY000_02060064 [Brassica cretica]|uniref:Uncharacterized protein n=1 Tax=Brassica cretica TaxID=69181 RepID=A0ABQ7ATV7_BRACR|nr:hypothetical protein DY000_02060064 [Brassica cretica]
MAEIQPQAPTRPRHPRLRQERHRVRDEPRESGRRLEPQASETRHVETRRTCTGGIAHLDITTLLNVASGRHLGG